MRTWWLLVNTHDNGMKCDEEKQPPKCEIYSTHGGVMLTKRWRHADEADGVMLTKRWRHADEADGVMLMKRMASC
jgi:hypothetical protein